jgi:hypothetical protein
MSCGCDGSRCGPSSSVMYACPPRTLALLLSAYSAAFALLVIGRTLGGALAYVYGVRVVGRDVPIADALIPGRPEEATPHRAGSGGRTDWTDRTVRG